MNFFNPFEDIAELGADIMYNIEKDLFDIEFSVNDIDIIPPFELKLTSTGKLSKKEMPKTRYNELYQDHVCSAALRIAREVFAHLPIDYVRVNAVGRLLNSSNGLIEKKIILSVIFVVESIRTMNIYQIDPSDSMSNFIHNMKFNKSNGFSEVIKAQFT